jgi:broad specificity phosphatase PhoE
MFEKIVKLYFVRHGESEANLTNEFSNRSLKHPLTAKGREQTRQLSKALSDIEFAKIYSSPILRAQETSMILSERFNVEIEIAPELREFDVGIYEGRSDQDAWDRYRDVVHAWINDQKFEERMEGGESFINQLERFKSLLEKIRAAHGTTNDSILLVSHGGLFRCMLPYLATNLTFEYCEPRPIKNTSYIIVEFQDDELVCLEWCGETLG